MIFHELRARLRGKQLFAVSNTLITRATGAVLQFYLNVVLGRLIGSSGLGQYYLFVSWLNIFGAVEGVGLPTLSLRRLSSSIAKGNHDEAHLFLKRAVSLSLVVTISVGLLAVLLNVHLAKLFFSDPTLSYIITFVAWSAIPFVLLGLMSSALRAYKFPTLSMFLQFALVPAALLIYAGYAFWVNIGLKPADIFSGYAIFLSLSALAALYIIFYSFKRNKAKEGGPSPKLFTERKVNIFPEANRFWIIALLTQGTANLPFILLPYFGSQAEIGLYGVASRLVSLATLILIALSSVYAPLFAEAFSLKQSDKLKTLLKQTQIYSLLAYLPMLVIFLAGSNWVLKFFGEEFVAAKQFLWILAIGQFINSATGLVTYFNLMTDEEKFETNVGGLILIFSAIFSIIAGSIFGVLGIAFAVTISNSLKNIISYLKSSYTLKIMAAENII